MNDQAHVLREIMQKNSEPVFTSSNMKVITVASGKGGVGKSNFSVNLAMAIKQLGKRVIILDADFGLANVEIILGEQPKYNLSHLINGEATITSLITESKYGVKFISGGSGVRDMNFLPAYQITRISQQLSFLQNYTDYLIIDTGAGINDIVVKFCNLANEVCMVVTPEPTAITDGYALLKTLISNFGLEVPVNIVVNKAESHRDAQDVFKKLDFVSNHFLKFDVKYMGYIPYDAKLAKAVREQIPICEYDAHAPSAKAYLNIARSIVNNSSSNIGETTSREGWFNKIKRIFSS